MSRKRNSNKSHSSATRPKNRRGPQGANFDEDHSMGGVDSSTTQHNKSQHRRRGHNICHPAHGQSQPLRHGHNRTNNPRDQYSHSNHNLHRNTQGRRVDARANGNPSMRRNCHTSRGSASMDNNSSDLVEKAGINTCDPPFPSLRCTNSGVYKSKNNSLRTCIECSSVRRANLRFRNWAASALNHCNQQFATWAEDAGVGFDTYDEMDWQPEPVIQVLILGGNLSPGSTASPTSCHPPINPFTSAENSQQPSIGLFPKPGPWAWPAWSGGTAQNGVLAASQVHTCGDESNQRSSLVTNFGILGCGGGGGNYSEVSGALLNQNPVGNMTQWSLREKSGHDEIEDY